MFARWLSMHRICEGSPIAARPAMRSIASIARCRRGIVTFEFLIVAPVMFLILFGIFYMSVALNNYLILTAAAAQGAQTLSLSRGTPTPYTTAKAAIDANANLTASSIGLTVKIGGSACGADSACSSLLTPGAVANVALSYPCNLTFMGFSFGGSPCNLSAQSAAIVQ